MSNQNSPLFSLGTPLQGTWWSIDKTRRWNINQRFGENLVDFYAKLGLEGHNGIDFYTQGFQDGQSPCFATHDGWVISDASIQSNTKGRYVEIMSDEVMVDGLPAKVRTVYFHLSKCQVSVNLKGITSWYGGWFSKYQNKVERGQQIGLCGNTGEYTTGAHLHFGLYIYWKQANGNYSTDYLNGYHGSNDPLPYFKDNKVYQYGENTNVFYFNGLRIPVDEARLKIAEFNH